MSHLIQVLRLNFDSGLAKSAGRFVGPFEEKLIDDDVVRVDAAFRQLLQKSFDDIFEVLI